VGCSEIVFIVNPHAGNGSTGQSWPDISALARDRLGPFDAFLTTGPGDAACRGRKAAEEGARLVVCVGGDGTLNEVVNGVMDADPGPDLAVGFIPNGTGCDFVRTVQIPRDTARAMERIAGGRRRTIDLGRLTFNDHAGHTIRRYFHNIASFGLGGEVDARVNRTTKAFGPFLSFIWATLLSILLYGKKRVRFRIDDGPEESAVIWNVAIANGCYHGGGMHVAPAARIDDGLFHVTVIGDLRLAEVFRHLPKLYNARIEQIDKVRILTGRRISAVSEDRVLLDVDGEQPGTLPLTAEILPGALRIVS
jgi:diacylglycerol kinase (ATP)